MKTNIQQKHSFEFYSVDTNGFVKFHKVNKNFFYYLKRWFYEKCGSISYIKEIVYETLKANYEFENNIKFPYYY